MSSELSGRLSPFSFAWIVSLRVGLPLAVCTAGLAFSFFLHPFPGWIVRLGAVVALWITVSGIASILLMVARYELWPDRLRYRPVWRREWHELANSDITGVEDRIDRWGPYAALVTAADGTAIVLSHRGLGQSQTLAAHLRNRVRRDPEFLSGGVTADAMAARFGFRIVGRSVALAALALGLTMIGIGIGFLFGRNPANIVPFGIVGSLLSLGGAGGLAAMHTRRRWISWFDLTDEEFRYRCNGRRRVETLSIRDLRRIERHRRDRFVAGREWEFLLILEGRPPVWIDDAAVTNGSVLVERLGRLILATQPPPPAPTPPPPVDGDDPRVAHFQPHLLPQEQLLWVGRPDLRHARGRTLALVLLFTPISLVGLAGGAAAIWAGRPVMLIPSLIATALGTAGLIELRRLRKRLIQTRYAVTNAGALVLGGVMRPGLTSPWGVSNDQVTRFFLQEIMNRDVPPDRPDVILRVSWFSAGTRNESRCETGFLACGDIAGAVKAMEWLGYLALLAWQQQQQQAAANPAGAT